VLGVTYFTTAKKRGTFVKRENLSLYTEENEATAKMQSAMRMSLAKKRVKAEVSWRAFNALDADDENRILARRQRLMSSALGARLTRDRLTPLELDSLEREGAFSTIEAEYDGPHLTFPLSIQQIMDMMVAFKEGRLLHYKYAVSLLSAYRKYANELPTLLEVEHVDNTRLTICGDTHGQLQDLYSIFTLNGVPSLTNRYLMNGDFVDRGDFSCEIVFTLMAFCLLYPGEPGTARGAGCLMNRGNHETHNQNLAGGFMSEVLDKYSAQGDGSNPESGLKMYDLFQSAFDSMPIAHLYRSGTNNVFVVHGGLMQKPGVTLEHVSSVKRRREIPYGLPGFEDKLYEELMWRYGAACELHRHYLLYH
jgi:protein phosphatase